MEDFNAISAEFALSRLPFIDIVDWYTNWKGLQIGSYRVMKLLYLCSKGAIDMIICYSREDFLEYRNSLDDVEEPFTYYRIPVYCKSHYTIIKDGKIISLSEYRF